MHRIWSIYWHVELAFLVITARVNNQVIFCQWNTCRTKHEASETEKNYCNKIETWYLRVDEGKNDFTQLARSQDTYAVKRNMQNKKAVVAALVSIEKAKFSKHSTRANTDTILVVVCLRATNFFNNQHRCDVRGTELEGIEFRTQKIHNLYEMRVR